MARKAKSNAIEMPDGSTRFLLERRVELPHSSLIGKLSALIGNLQAIVESHPGVDFDVEDGTPYEQAEIYLTAVTPETDEEYANRLAEEERRRKAIEDENNRARDKAIQRRARRDRPLTEKQERALLQALKDKYPDA